MTRSELTWLCRRYTRVYQLSVVWCGVAWRRVVAIVTEAQLARPERTKSRASRRVRDCVHACIRPFVCSGFDEAAFTPAPKRHEPINPHLLSVSPTLRALLYPRASTSPEFRWSSPGNRFISPAFLSLRPTVAFQFVPSLFHRFHGDVARPTFWSPVCFYLSRGCIPYRGNFIPLAPRVRSLTVAARSITVYKDRGKVRYRRMSYRDSVSLSLSLFLSFCSINRVYVFGEPTKMTPWSLGCASIVISSSPILFLI